MGSRVQFATKHESVQIKNEWRAESMTDVMQCVAQPTVEEMKAISAQAYQKQLRKFVSETTAKNPPQTPVPATQQEMFAGQSFTRGQPGQPRMQVPQNIQPLHTVQKMVFVCVL